MARTNDITIKINADDNASDILKKLQKEIAGVGTSSTKAAPKVGKKGLGGSIDGLVASSTPYIAAAVGIGAAIKGIVAPAFNAAREVESLKAQLKAVQGSAQAAETRFIELSKVSKEITGLNLNNLIKYDNILQTVGLSAEDSTTILTGLAEAASEAGLSADKTRSVTEQLSQAFATNKVASEDLKTVWRELPAVQTVAKDLFGETAGTIEGLRKTFQQLGIDARTGLTILFEGVEKVSEIDVETFNAQWEMFNETMNQWAATLGGPIVDNAKSALKELNEITAAIEYLNEKSKKEDEGFLKFAGDVWELNKAALENVVTVASWVNVFSLFGKGVSAVVDDVTEEMKEMEEVQKTAQQNVSDNDERLREESKTARLAYLAAANSDTELSFAARRTLADNYFNAEEERINGLTVTDEEKNELLVENAKNHKTAIETIDKEQTTAKANELKNQLTDAQTYYADLKRDEGTSAEALKDARLGIYNYNKQIIENTETDETKKKAALAQLATDLKDDLKTIEDDKAAYNQEKRDEEIEAEEAAKKAKDDLATAQREFAGNEMEKRASDAKLELGKILDDETTSLTDRQTANNNYYGWLKLEAKAREDDETKLATKLNEIEGNRIEADRTIIKGYTKEQDDARKETIKKQTDAKNEAIRIAEEEKGSKITKLEELEVAQEGVLAELDRNENTSADVRIEAVKRLFGIKLAKLQADKGDTEEYKTEKIRLENELKDAVANIVEEDRKNKETARNNDLTEQKRVAKERVDVAQQAYNDVKDSAQSSAQEINEATRTKHLSLIHI